MTVRQLEKLLGNSISSEDSYYFIQTKLSSHQVCVSYLEPGQTYFRVGKFDVIDGPSKAYSLPSLFLPELTSC